MNVEKKKEQVEREKRHRKLFALQCVTGAVMALAAVMVVMTSTTPIGTTMFMIMFLATYGLGVWHEWKQRDLLYGCLDGWHDTIDMLGEAIQQREEAERKLEEATAKGS